MSSEILLTEYAMSSKTRADQCGNCQRWFYSTPESNMGHFGARWHICDAMLIEELKAAPKPRMLLPWKPILTALAIWAATFALIYWVMGVMG